MTEKGKRLKALDLLREGGAPPAAGPKPPAAARKPAVEGPQGKPKGKTGTDLSTDSGKFRAFTGQVKAAPVPAASTSDSRGHADSGVFIEPADVSQADSVETLRKSKDLRKEVADLRKQLEVGLAHEKEMREEFVRKGNKLAEVVKELESRLNAASAGLRVASGDATVMEQIRQLDDIDLEPISDKEAEQIDAEQLTVRHKKTGTAAKLTLEMIQNVLPVVDAYCTERNFATKGQLDELTANVKVVLNELQRRVVGMVENLRVGISSNLQSIEQRIEQLEQRIGKQG